MKTLLWTMSACLLLFGCGKEEGIDVAALCKKNLVEMYPEAKDAAWETFGQYQIGKFHLPSEKADMEVWFTTDAACIMKKYDYGTNDEVVPWAVSSQLMRYPGETFTMKSVCKYEKFHLNRYDCYWEIRAWDSNNKPWGGAFDLEKTRQSVGDSRVTPDSRTWDLGTYNAHP